MSELQLAFEHLPGYMRSLATTTNTTCPSTCDTCVIDCVCKASAECRNVVVLVFGIVFGIVVFVLITGYASWRVFKKNKKYKAKQAEYNFDNTAPNLNISQIEPRSQSQMGIGLDERAQENINGGQVFQPTDYKASPRAFQFQANPEVNPNYSLSEYPTRDVPQFAQQEPVDYNSPYQQSYGYQEQPRRYQEDTYERKVSARNYQSPSNRNAYQGSPYRPEEEFDYKRNPNVMSFDQRLPPIILKPYEEDRI
jgi:hypothetical protein